MRKILVLLAAVAVFTISVGATPPTDVTGTFAVVTAVQTDTRTAGGNTFTTLERTASLSGTFTGTATDTVEVVMHANGATSVHGVGTCICTIEGVAGTFEYRFQASGTEQTGSKVFTPKGRSPVRSLCRPSTAGTTSTSP